MTDVASLTTAEPAASATPPLLSVRDLAVEFQVDGEVHRAVDGIAFDIAEGETFALVGESGSGKTVTASAIIGLLPGNARVASGSIALQGDEILAQGRPTAVRFRGSRIGMIFQNPLSSLDPSFKIGNQLREIIGLHRPETTRRQQEETARTWLGHVGIGDADRVLNAYPHELSGGMRQRVMLALASLSQPALLIADEPTTSLDAVIQQQILDLLKSVTTETGSSLLIITHDFGVVSYIADRVAVMRAGRIVELDERDRVLSDPSHEYSRSLIAAVPEIGARLHLRELGLVNRLGPLDSLPPATRRRDVGRDTVPRAGDLLRLNDVSKEFVIGGLGTGLPRRRFSAVDEVSLSIRRGEVFGLIGESGSGKSTLARLIGGLHPVTSGTIAFDGHEIANLSKRRLRELRPRFQFVFQDATSSLNPRIRVGEQIVRPLLRFGKAASRKAAAARVREVLGLVNLPDSYASRFPHELSGGQRQRIGIARALALEPDLLILDEPTSALDVSTQATILNLLLDLKDELDLTYLFIGHNLAIIEFLCDRIGVLDNGALLETFDATELAAAERHPVTKALLGAVLPIDREP
ncbi:dipeptide ABC transporter ATP-binding protein [Jiangella endophytica]|uniref:dipeptide ABC transporter ATP-binding protein n=1 Tax=Jiangella endophytica TaxID=1623398 RepID=UPI0018E520BB|nr:ABC transporter ATP-binding protein [Jiangella endophytica]